MKRPSEYMVMTDGVTQQDYTNALNKYIDFLEAQLKSHNTFNCNEKLEGNKKCDRQCARVDCYHLNK